MAPSNKTMKTLIFSFCSMVLVAIGLNIMLACGEPIVYECKFVNHSAEDVVIYCKGLIAYVRLDFEFISSYAEESYGESAPIPSVYVDTLRPSETAIIRDRVDDDDYPNYLHIFVLQESLLERYTMEELKERNLYSDYLIYEYKQLKKRNFTINYYGESPR